MNLSIPKLLFPPELAERRAQLEDQGKSLVLTNGCFDLLHAGHVYSLETAKKQGDVLWVGVNSDRSVRQLKGDTRPIYPQEARLYLLNALACVDGVFLFDDTNLAGEIQQIKPDVYVKSGDYTLDTLNPVERQALEACHTRITFLPFLKGWSTSNTLAQIASR